MTKEGASTSSGGGGGQEDAIAMIYCAQSKVKGAGGGNNKYTDLHIRYFLFLFIARVYFAQEYIYCILAQHK